MASVFLHVAANRYLCHSLQPTKLLCVTNYIFEAWCSSKIPWQCAYILSLSHVHSSCHNTAHESQCTPILSKASQYCPSTSSHAGPCSAGMLDDSSAIIYGGRTLWSIYSRPTSTYISTVSETIWTLEVTSPCSVSPTVISLPSLNVTSDHDNASYPNSSISAICPVVTVSLHIQSLSVVRYFQSLINTAWDNNMWVQQDQEIYSSSCMYTSFTDTHVHAELRLARIATAQFKLH